MSEPLYINTFNTLDESSNNNNTSINQSEMINHNIDEHAPVGGFEGCEKRLVVTFASTADLRSIARPTIDAMLTEAKCTIISERKNAHYDSYVLSESSLFIFPNKLLLKTCGTTTLLNAIPTLLQAAKEIGTEPVRVQFSRYDFLFPEKQPYPHNCFSSEVEYLNSYFKNGRAYILGPVYSTAAETNVISAPTIHNTAFDNSNAGNTPRWHLYIADCGATELPGADDHTFEMVMFDLDRDIMRKFYRPPTEDEKDLAEYPSSAEDSTIRAGIDMIIPGSEIDAFLFNPCGYSCNALKDELYFTIHITPEPQCSFVSFEANVHMDNYTELVQKLVDTFRPGSFCVSVFSSSDASRVDMSQQYDGFITQSSMLCQLQGNYFVNCGQFAGMNPPTCPTHPARTAMVTEELKVIFPTVSKTLPLLQPLKTDEEAVYAPSSDLEDSCNSLSQSQYPVKYVREEDDPTQLRFANSYSMIEADDLSYDIMER